MTSGKAAVKATASMWALSSDRQTVRLTVPPGSDGGDSSALCCNLFLRFGKSMRVDAAIRTPMSAMEGHCDGTILKQLVQADKLTVLVG